MFGIVSGTGVTLMQDFSTLARLAIVITLYHWGLFYAMEDVLASLVSIRWEPAAP